METLAPEQTVWSGLLQCRPLYALELTLSTGLCAQGMLGKQEENFTGTGMSTVTAAVPTI